MYDTKLFLSPSLRALLQHGKSRAQLMAVLVAIALFWLPAQARAAAAIEAPAWTARATCAGGHPEYSGENFRWVQTSRWPVYAWTMRPFDSRLPTALFFDGGPGQSSHATAWALDGWNVIFFDQLGIGCSKPNEPLALKDLTNYGSRQTADDARRVLDAFGVRKASLLAVSYGSVPATIFASLFPERTSAVVLEGTLFSGGPELHAGAYRQRLLREFFESLPSEIRARLRRWSSQANVPEGWFGRMGAYCLTLNDGLEKLRLLLDRLLEDPGDPDADFLNSFGTRPFTDTEFGPSATVFAAIACGELGLNDTQTRGGSRINGDTLEAIVDNPLARMCAAHGSGTNEFYQAERFPIPRPIVVTYFQGEHDGATELPLARRHFERVAQGPAQFALRLKGGHSPLLSEMLDPYAGDRQLTERYRRMLRSALTGQDLRLAPEDSTVWRLEHR